MNVVAHKLDGARLLQKLRSVLRDTKVADDSIVPLVAGVELEHQARAAAYLPARRIPAAVLVPIVQHETELTVLFTERASHLKHHAGQISFPGGRIEEQEDALQAALRETQEEIGLASQYVEVLGYLPPHWVFTGYCVTPVVALVQPGFDLQIDMGEVASVFEVPLRYLIDPAHHQARDRLIGEIALRVYDLPYGERRIWGATAGILMNLYRLLAAETHS
jgi:8-oxo-dGTP pyrophosphatase MutT (NUDIX family)